MKIVTWNCAGAFRKKYEYLSVFNADILVIQECECPVGGTPEYRDWAQNYFWIGNKHKGVGIFARKNIELKKLEWKSEGLKYFLVCEVNGTFNLVAVWTLAEKNSKSRYITQFLEFLQIHANKFASIPTVICGDFNSNAIWDGKYKGRSHSDVVDQLSCLGIVSLYHHQTGEMHGMEKAHTFFLHRSLSKPYHIDYAFISRSLMHTSKKMQIGTAKDWMSFSDHLPLAFELKTNLPAN
jgi:exonuclease III